MNYVGCAVILALVSCALVVNGDKPDQDHSRKLTKLKKVSDANFKFAFQVYHQLASTTGPSNIIISPFSISNSLAMVYLGARGNTSLHMKKAMNLGQLDHLEDVLDAFKEIISDVAGNTGGYFLYMADALFGDKSLTPTMDYLTNSQTYFGVQLQSVDFRHNATGATKEMNEWVAKKTNMKILNVIPKGMITPWTRLVLMNSIFFQGSWVTPFDKSKTDHNYNFFTSSFEHHGVTMMHVTATFLYGEDRTLNCKAVELPYVSQYSQDQRISLYIILPNNKTGGIQSLRTLERLLAAQAPFNVAKVFQFSRRTIKVSIPRFQISKTIPIMKTLSSMGMKDLFSSAADLSGITGKRNLQVTNVEHQAVIGVDEYGTHAAAATAGVIGLTAIHQIGPIQEFIADHPFLFLMMDSLTQSILFIGRFETP